SLKVEPVRGNLFKCTDMIEKPSPDKVFSLYSILGRCVLTPDIFDILDKTPPGAGGEIQLTDAMRVLARTRGMMAVDFTGTRYDMGNKLGILQASVEVALRHPEIGPGFREYLKGIAKTL
ncbi:MAG TPA: UTP--glucose-1-phosphate uridylyltransferase, partial [Ruminococcaceae bacterium]|nr:UTP--glucose-1-phosphate uridylyltransferase [Oscillospiraceae bacterium]